MASARRHAFFLLAALVIPFVLTACDSAQLPSNSASSVDEGTVDVLIRPNQLATNWVASSRTVTESSEFIASELLLSSQRILCADVSVQLITGDAPCPSTRKPDSINVFLNKTVSLQPIDFVPPALRATNLIGGHYMRDEAATAIEELAAASETEGAGRIGTNSGYRSYENQKVVRDGFLRSRGEEWTEMQSALPGHSEHQTGLAVDVVACNSYGCGSIYEFEGSSQQRWIAENAYRFGFIVRYEASEVDVTNFSYEPWHLRFIGKESAYQYHQGGFKSLENFLGY